MTDAISNTSPLVYLHRAGVLDWLPRLNGEERGFGELLSSIIGRLRESGMWMSDDLYRRVLALAGEDA